MAGYTIEVGWGDYLNRQAKKFCIEEGITQSALLEAVAAVTGETRNTIRKLLGEAEPPTGRKDRSRATALVIAIGEEPETFQLADADLMLPLKALGRKKLRSTIRAAYTEPGDFHYLRCATSRVA